MSCKVKDEIIIVMRIEFSANKESIKLYNMLQQVTLKGLRIPHSGLRIPDSLPSTNPTKTWRTVIKFTFHRLLSLLRWVKTIATRKTVIESMQSLGMDNSRVVYTRFLAFYSDNPSGLQDDEPPAKWQSEASFTTHP